MSSYDAKLGQVVFVDIGGGGLELEVHVAAVAGFGEGDGNVLTARSWSTLHAFTLACTMLSWPFLHV